MRNGLGVTLEELDNEQIVQLVKSQGEDEPDEEAEEDDDDTCVCDITIQQAVTHAEELERFALSNPEHLNAEIIATIGNARRELQKKAVASKKQSTLAGFLGL